MARPRSVPDPVVHDAVLALIRHGGDKAVTFSAVAARAGLAASSLAERHGSVAGMIAAARAGAWDRLEQATAAAIEAAPLSPKGATGLLKALSQAAVPPLSSDPARALRWRAGLESALAVRLGGTPDAREAAAILFAVWQDRSLWQGHAEPPVRLKAVLKRLGL
jgi:AcrR family transcriptional regulator